MTARDAEIATRFRDWEAREPSVAGRLGRIAAARHHALRDHSAIAARGGAEPATARTVLLRLLAHPDSAASRERRAWIHPAPAIPAAVDDWLRVAELPTEALQFSSALRDFVRRSVDDPGDLAASCHELAARNGGGLPMSVVAPILNALCPESFFLIDEAALRILNAVLGAAHADAIADFPAANEAANRIVSRLAAEAAPRAFTDAPAADVVHEFLLTLDGARFAMRREMYEKWPPMW